jgi:hypothetical protein
MIFPVALYGYETSSLILREVHGLRGLENRVLMRMFGPTEMKCYEAGENCILRNLTNCALRKI